MSTAPQDERPHDEQTQDEPSPDAVAVRAELLPEELAAGSDDPKAQAEEILEESIERTEHPDPDESTQSGRRHSDDTV